MESIFWKPISFCQAMDSEGDQLNLMWNDFRDNINNTFRSLREDKEYADVTLACEDGLHVEAHQAILASSSPFFLSFLRDLDQPHPIITMPGFKSANVLAMMDFLYHGEADVDEEHLKDFLAAAEELKLKGLVDLSRNSWDQPDPLDIQKKLKKKKKPSKIKLKLEKLSEKIYEDVKVEFTKPSRKKKKKSRKSYEEEMSIPDILDTKDNELSARILSMIEISENLTSTNRPARICKICGKEGKQQHIENHIEAHHITGLAHSCVTCGKTFKTRNSLNNHKSIKHGGSVKHR